MSQVIPNSSKIDALQESKVERSWRNMFGILPFKPRRYVREFGNVKVELILNDPEDTFKTKSKSENVFSLNKFFKELLTYGFLLSYYGLIIALTRYDCCKIDLLKARVSSEYSSIISSLAGLVFMPLSVFGLLCIRSYFNVHNLTLPALVFNAVYITLLGSTNLLERHSFYYSSLFIYGLLIRPILNALYFYCISDIFQCYNSKLSNFYILVIGALSQVIASFYKDLAIYMISFGYSIFGPLKILGAMNLLLVLLQTSFRGDKSYIPTPAAASSVFSSKVNRRIYGNPLIIGIIVYTLSFACLQEINEAIKVEALSVKIKTIENFQKYSLLFKADLTKPIKATGLEEHKNPHTLIDKFNALFARYMQKIIPRNSETRAVIPYTVNLKLNKEIVDDATSKDVFKLVHKRELDMESLLNMVLQMLSFMVLFYNFLDSRYQVLLLSILFIAVPYLQYVISSYVLDDILLITMLFNAIDTGFKKSVKDLPYIVFNFETKNYIKMYLEYAIEPLARIIGGLIGYRLRAHIHHPLGLKINNLNTLYTIYNTISFVWFLSGLFIVYNLLNLLKRIKDEKISIL